MSRKRIQTDEQADDTGQELVPTKLSRSLVPELGTPIQLCPSNLDMNTVEGRSLAINAIGSQDLNLDANGRISFLCMKYLVYQVERLNQETGEMECWPRTVFFNENGETFATTSIVVPDALAAMLALFSDEDWERGIPVRIITKPNQRGVGSHHELRIITRAELAASKMV